VVLTAVCLHVRVCVVEEERKTERERHGEREGERDREKEREREKERASEREKEREGERERESMRVFVCVCACLCSAWRPMCISAHLRLLTYVVRCCTPFLVIHWVCTFV